MNTNMKTTRNLFSVLVLVTVIHGTAFGETSRGAGIVTTLQGEAIVTRAGGVQPPIPMKFRDEVFFKDRISVKEHSLLRVLMGGKALVTVRELSDLTVSEMPNKPTVLDMLSGKISLAVAKMRMRPGEAIEVRTPNAIAAVRGTTLVVEVMPGLESNGSGKPADMVTNIHVLSGKVDVFSASSPNAPPVSVRAGFSVSVNGALVGPLRPNPPVGQVTKGLDHTFQHTETPDGTKNTLTAREMVKVVALSENMPDGSTGTLSVGTINPPPSLGTSSLGTSILALPPPTIIMPPTIMLTPLPTMMPPPPPTILLPTLR